MTEPFDIAIVGAGVAGLAAAERAAQLGLATIVLEASGHIGGRVRSFRLSDGNFMDLGAHWLLQVPINPFVPEAEAIGAITSKPWQPIAGIWINGTWLDEMDVAAIEEQVDDLETLAQELALTGEDAAVADLIDPLFTLQTPLRLVLEHRLGITPNLHSAVDLSRWARHDGFWPVGGGLGELVSRIYSQMEVKLNSEVKVIDWGSDPVRLETEDNLIEAHHVIVTTSVDTLQSGEIHFAPDLPEATSRAIEAFNMTAETRLTIDFGSQLSEWPAESLLLTTTDGLPIAFETPVASKTIGTAALRSLNSNDWPIVRERASDVFGIDQYAVALLNAPDWQEAPGFGSGTAALPPGAGQARFDLAVPIDDRLYFAGEATSITSFGTVHGARQEGIRAVNAIAGELGLLPEVEDSRDTSSVFRFDY